MQRHRESAGFPARKQGDDVVVTGFAQQRNTRVIEILSSVAQRGREPRRVVSERGVRPAGARIDDRNAVAARIAA